MDLSITQYLSHTMTHKELFFLNSHLLAADFNKN